MSRRILGRALLFLFVAITLGCTNLFYVPSRRLHGWPEGPFTTVSIPTADGLRLTGWLFAPRGERKGTVVQFHGNAGNITSHFRSLQWVTERGYAFLTFDYRGYGASPGIPSPEGLEQDALAAIRFATSLPIGAPASEAVIGGRWGEHAPTASKQDIVLYGQSLGGAVLLHAFAAVRDRSRIRALVVEGSFHSYQEAAASIIYRSPLLLPLTGFAYALVSDAYAPSRYVADVAPTPLLLIHGDADPLIPVDFAHALYGLARDPRELWIVPRGGHVDAMRRSGMRDRLIAYLDGVPGGVDRTKESASGVIDPSAGAPTAKEPAFTGGSWR